MVENWSPPKKREACLSQVWFKYFFSLYIALSNSPKSFKTSALSRLLCSKIVLNLNYNIASKFV